MQQFSFWCRGRIFSIISSVVQKLNIIWHSNYRWWMANLLCQNNHSCARYDETQISTLPLLDICMMNATSYNKGQSHLIFAVGNGSFGKHLLTFFAMTFYFLLLLIFSKTKSFEFCWNFQHSKSVNTKLMPVWVMLIRLWRF